MVARTSMPDDKRRHFFVSFSQADREWATWVAWVLEENGYLVFFQDWDFRGSFIEQMHRASQRAERTLVIEDSWRVAGLFRCRDGGSTRWASLIAVPS